MGNDRFEPVTIYVQLIDEGTDVWRPVPAKQLADGVFEILEYHAIDENPAFPIGSKVHVEERELNVGLTLVAVRLAT